MRHVPMAVYTIAPCVVAIAHAVNFARGNYNVSVLWIVSWTMLTTSIAWAYMSARWQIRHAGHGPPIALVHVDTTTHRLSLWTMVRRSCFDIDLSHMNDVMRDCRFEMMCSIPMHYIKETTLYCGGARFVLDIDSALEVSPDSARRLVAGLSTAAVPWWVCAASLSNEQGELVIDAAFNQLPHQCCLVAHFRQLLQHFPWRSVRST